MGQPQLSTFIFSLRKILVHGFRTNKKNLIFFVKVKPLPKNFVVYLKIYAHVKVNTHEKNFVIDLKIYTSKGTRGTKKISLRISRFAQLRCANSKMRGTWLLRLDFFQCVF